MVGNCAILKCRLSAKGNYVVGGGDWNQNPPDFEPGNMESDYKVAQGEIFDRTLFPENWEICFDPKNPTNRGIETPLLVGQTEVTVIDYFILSPNINLEEIKVLSQNFQNSDHEPVYMKISLN